MDKGGLANRVKVKLDEFTPEGVGLPFDEYIGPLLDESARDLVLQGPLHLLSPTSIPLTSVAYADGKAYIPVPADWVRLYELKYPLWKKPVREAISKENPEYKLQENEYLRSGYGRPSVAVVTTVIGGGAVTRYLECGRVDDPGATPLTPVALYVAETKPEDLNDQLVDALTWNATAKVLSVMGMQDKARAAMEQYVIALKSLML